MPGPDDLSLLIDAAKASGEIAAKFWQQSPEIWDKSGNAGPVTEADLAVDKMLHSDLRAARPDYGWLSEETEDDATRLTREHVFIIDPIDGTRAFIEGSRTFAHSLAIAHKGEITAAVVYLPMLDKLYVASADRAASLNGAPITPSDASTPATVLGRKCLFAPDHWGGTAPPYKPHFRASLAYRMCLVAEGRFDAMLCLNKTWEWDVAAGTLIAMRAGAKVSDMRGAAARFNNPQPQLDGMIAAGSALHPEICEGLAKGRGQGQ